jgi:hypothetical protein
MSTVKFLFHDTRYAVSKTALPKFIESHPNTDIYRVQSAVPPDAFDAFVDSLATQRPPAVTNANALFLSLPAREFLLPDLASACAPFPVSVNEFSSLFERVSALERGLLTNRRLQEQIESQDRSFENLRSDVQALKKFRKPPDTAIPLSNSGSLQGIISHLGRANVAISSKSVFDDDPETALSNLYDPTSRSSGRFWLATGNEAFWLLGHDSEFLAACQN